MSDLSQEINQMKGDIHHSDFKREFNACEYYTAPSWDVTAYCPGCEKYYCRYHWESNKHLLDQNCISNLRLHW